MGDGLRQAVIYSDAIKSAMQVLNAIAPHCQRAEIAGSIRRKKAVDIKDIELVGLPRPISLSALQDVVNNRWGDPISGRFPSKYTKVRSNLAIDFFWPSPETWGLCLFIRTGPADFVKRALGYWKTITLGGYSNECQLHRPDGTIFPTPEEEDVFRALKVKFIPPDKRV